mmetsp:Transcript_34681/g.64241  ORF Transcript_34681/g.64241 Transcript_34681/m.64241 type:complete len:449 (+) Transcript_34681:96-1442(+)
MAAIAGLLRKGEEDWQERIERLQERFPTVSCERVLQAVRANNGHAGYAATELRELGQEGIKNVDPDDSEWVATLLTSPAMFRQYCKQCFQEFDTDRNGVLDWSEVIGLTNKLCHQLGLAQPAEINLRTVFQGVDVNGDEVLQEDEFAKFFEIFLRYAFFEEHRRLVGTWQYKANPNEQTDGFSEYAIFQTTDWHMCFEGLQGQCPGGHQLAASSANRTLGGTLDLREGWLHAKVKVRVKNAEGHTTKKTTYGFVRLHLAEGSKDVLVSNFKSSEVSEWGENIFAYRKNGDRSNTPPEKETARWAYRKYSDFSARSSIVAPLGSNMFVPDEQVYDWSGLATDGGRTPMSIASSPAGLQSGRKPRRSKSHSGITAAKAGPTAVRCVATDGVAYRASPEFFDRTEVMLACGEKVQILEQRDATWFRTPQGWLPMHDAGGKLLFERASSRGF